MIVMNSVTKKFGYTEAVSAITFTANRGEVIGFLGPNGAGKTTTMRIILGYLSPTGGSVKVNGIDPMVDRITVLKQIGYLPENNPLFPDMKVREYLQFIAEVKKVHEFSDVAKEVGVTDVLEKKVEELSRGYRQRVGLAAALLGDPPILILDQPTSGLDPIEQEKIRELILSLAKKKKTVLFSSHILPEVEAVASKLIIIDQGKLVYNGDKPTGRGAVEKLFKKLVIKIA